MKKFVQKSTPKFKYLQRYFGQKPFTLLDVGSGNHSASKTKSLFPNCEYHGIDLQKDFNNDEFPDFESAGFEGYFKFCTQPNMIFAIRESWMSADDYIADMNTQMR